MLRPWFEALTGTMRSRHVHGKDGELKKLLEEGA